MKTEFAVMIALSVALGELTTSAAVLPASAAFGGSFQNAGTDVMNLGSPASTSATSATAFVDIGSEDTTESPTITVGTTYRFRLTYDQASRDVTFLHLNSAGGTLNTLTDTDVYTELFNDNQGWAKNLDTLTGFAFGFSAPSGYSVTVTNLTLTGATWVSGGPSKDLTVFTGSGANATPGASDYITGNYFLPATGLSDGFTLDGYFVFSGSGGTGTPLISMEVYAVVPEPATVAFGLAMVGGLGLVEIRRRKKA